MSIWAYLFTENISEVFLFISDISEVYLSMIERETPFTIYCLRVGYRQWITTDIIEITAFCIFMQELGNADPIGETFQSIPLTANY